MGLDFGKSSMGNPAQAGNGLQEKNEIEVVEKYDIVAAYLRDKGIDVEFYQDGE